VSAAVTPAALPMNCRRVNPEPVLLMPALSSQSS
jgi:hypothetical protein